MQEYMRLFSHTDIDIMNGLINDWLKRNMKYIKVVGRQFSMTYSTDGDYTRFGVMINFTTSFDKLDDLMK